MWWWDDAAIDALRNCCFNSVPLWWSKVSKPGGKRSALQTGNFPRTSRSVFTSGPLGRVGGGCGRGLLCALGGEEWWIGPDRMEVPSLRQLKFGANKSYRRGIPELDMHYIAQLLRHFFSSKAQGRPECLARAPPTWLRHQTSPRKQFIKTPNLRRRTSRVAEIVQHSSSFALHPFATLAHGCASASPRALLLVYGPADGGPFSIAYFLSLP